MRSRTHIWSINLAHTSSVASHACLHDRSTRWETFSTFSATPESPMPLRSPAAISAAWRTFSSAPLRSFTARWSFST